MTMPGMIDVRDFGVKGDGRTDDTASLLKAIDAAGSRQATLCLPAGTYLCSTLKIHPRMGLQGYPAFTYRGNGGSILKLNDPKARCLLDLSTALGATINGVCLDGNDKMGDGIHGIMVDRPDYGQQEDNVRIERCRVSGFSGHGVMLGRIWCFSVRHCMICFNGGNGIRVRGWDGFVLDNWLSGNGSAGYGAYDENCAVTITANRIEWNATAGIEIHGGSGYNINGNYLDRSGGPAIKFMPSGREVLGMTTITGNVISRSGAPNPVAIDPLDNCHIRLDSVNGVVCTGNTMRAGRDDGNKGVWSPQHGIVLHKLTDSIVKDNVMWEGAIKTLLEDQGEHGQNAIIRDNVGQLRITSSQESK